MKTTININGLDVEFTDQKPTRVGVYYNTHDPEDEPRAIEVVEHTILGLIGQFGNDTIVTFEGLWSAPLVPVTEVEKAYKEGQTMLALRTDHWPNSRARKVVEGVQ